jgi:hypothetical protein
MKENHVFDPIPESALENHEHDGDDFEPLEVDALSHDFNREETLFEWRDPWLLTSMIVLGLIVPSLMGGIIMIFSLTGKIWPAFLLCVHLMAALLLLSRSIPSNHITKPPLSLTQRILSALVDAFLFAKLYSQILQALLGYIFTDIDDTPIIEYGVYSSSARLLIFLGLTIAVSRICIEAVSIVTIVCQRFISEDEGTSIIAYFPVFGSTVPQENTGNGAYFGKARQIRRMLQMSTNVALSISVGFLLWSTYSVVVHCINWSSPSIAASFCDSVDTTECILPFPSMEYMVPDKTTDTGWRVNIQSDTLPRLKGRKKIYPDFWNKLDGFSTMAPILFYMEGLKEAHEKGENKVRLQGPQEIVYSLTSLSITSLVDVDNMILVPHSAEIDYLDSERPLVLVFPSQPLRHSGHYALAVMGACDVNGDLLPATSGMTLLLSDEHDTRQIRYRQKVLPALHVAAPWSQEEKLQLLFDFVTISESSQLGSIRAARDATLEILGSSDWIWKHHSHVTRIIDFNCTSPDALIARTVHGKLDVPWFLQKVGSGNRDSLINLESLRTGKPRLQGLASFVVHIPCSVRAAALTKENGMPLKAVIDYGHGLFYNREEASWTTFHKMANKNGYIITAMDWRGMSLFDLPIVIKTLMSKPNLFQAIRDNLIQGYVNKLALQHFARHRLLEMDWMMFNDRSGSKNLMTIPRDNVSFVFYGISQGGILGAGYTTLLGPTSLIDRSILGVPGTPFALVMSRSIDFLGYDKIMLFNFYNNRDVRIFLSLAQMLWDSCEGSGFLAPPHQRDYPRLLLQAGLGDNVVPSLAAEALARAFNASILPNNPRPKIYGIHTDSAATEESLGPWVTLTELLYKKENASLPSSDNFNKLKVNAVHWCVREDSRMVAQVEEFVNSGRILDVCQHQGCVREDTSHC